MAVNNSSRQPLLFAHHRCHALTVRLVQLLRQLILL
jgi:hypothetical protein